MSKLKIGVVGVGAIGINHARVYSEMARADLVAIYDADPGRAKEVAERFGTTAVDSVEDLVARVDAASVATPTVTHVEVGKLLMDAGKHVLVEKPISDTLDGARELVEKARDAGVILQVGHIERFNPVMGLIEERLTAPKFIEAHRLSPFPNRSMDIGVVLDVMIHDLEIILHLVRSEIESIDAVGVPVLTHREDIANARLRFKSGCVANVTASRISPEKMRKLRVFQEDTYLSLDYQNQSGELYRREGMEIVREEVAVEKDEPLKLELRAFVDCASGGGRPKVSGYEGMAALDVAMEITRLIAEGAKKAQAL